MQKKYRKCVGMMILNARNQILVGRRLDHPSGYWQMPQGGIDENENPEFSEWKWMDYDEISQNAVPFKRNVYIKIQKEFRSNLVKV